MPRSGRAALQVVRDAELRAEGDPDERQKAIHGWSDGQRECRAERKHYYKQVRTYVFGKDPDKVGTRMNIVEECSRCRSVGRSADHVRTPRGLRRVEDWTPHYHEFKGVPYLLAHGLGRLDDGDKEELTGMKYLKPAKFTFVPNANDE